MQYVMFNKLTIMAASLPDTPPLEFIEAAADAGYEGVGLRLHASPSFPRWQDWLSDATLKREVKRALERSGAKYVSLSGSGSAVYGLFADQQSAGNAAARLSENGVPAQATVTMTRERYWKEMMKSPGSP